MPTRKRTAKRRLSKKRGGAYALTPYNGKRRGRSAWPGIKKWFTKSALPWLKTQIPKAHKYVKDNKLISKGIRKFGKNYDFGETGNNYVIPGFAGAVEMLGYGKRRRGAKMVKYRKKNGRGLNHTGGARKKKCRRRKRK